MLRTLPGERTRQTTRSPSSPTGALPPGYPLRVISAQAAAASGARTGRAGDSGGFRTRWALLISVAGGLALYASFPAGTS